MKLMRTTAVLIATLALVACGQSAPQAEAPAAEQPIASAPAAPEGTPSAAELVGTWGDNGDCNLTTTINADGTFTNFSGNTGTWTLEGDVLTMTSPRGVARVRVSKPNENQLIIGGPDGSFGLSQRC
jgi:hypothetical protein